LSRLPIRLRLTLAFACVMAFVLAAIGVFMHARLESELDAGINQGLRSRADDIAALVRQADKGLAESRGSRLAKRGVSFAQVIDARGRLLDATPELRVRKLIDSAELARAQRGTTVFEQEQDPLAGPVRLLATPVRAQDQRLVVIAGSSLRDRNRALDQLAALLVIGGSVSLVLAALAGYGLAAAALRPVEAMRERAAALSASKPGKRLPVPPGSDEIARLGVTLNEMLGRLEGALERERSFVANASHELMTPLSILQAELDLASERPAEELVGAVRSAREETGRLTRLSRDLLALARSDRGQLSVEPAHVDAVALLDRVAARFNMVAAARGHAIVTSVPGPVTIFADGARLEQAFNNLVDNSLRHGGGRVELGARATGEQIELHVRDEGPGLPPSLLERAFERFTRAGDGDHDGAGLGLAIVATIAAAHGGTAHVANRPGGGADFWLALPRIAANRGART
jgi:two-component system, OmpR family, sensor kinase